METLEKIINGLQVTAEEIFKFKEDSEYKKALDEHITLISGKSTDTIVSLTKISKEFLNAIEKSYKNSE